MKTTYEYIVLGLGGIGSGAVYWLARQAGKEVLGLEQFELDQILKTRLQHGNADVSAAAPSMALQR